QPPAVCLGAAPRADRLGHDVADAHWRGGYRGAAAPAHGAAHGYHHLRHGAHHVRVPLPAAPFRQGRPDWRRQIIRMFGPVMAWHTYPNEKGGAVTMAKTLRKTLAWVMFLTMLVTALPAFATEVATGPEANAARELVNIRFSQYANSVDDQEGMANDPIKKAIE